MQSRYSFMCGSTTLKIAVNPWNQSKETPYGEQAGMPLIRDGYFYSHEALK